MPLHIQLIDKFGMAATVNGSHGTASWTPVANEDIWFSGRPGEARFCGGCHENRTATAPIAPGVQASVLAGAVNLDVPRAQRVDGDGLRGDASGNLPAGSVAGDVRVRGVPWDKALQPIFDAKCVSCHNGDATKSYNPSYTVTDMTTGTSQTFVFDLRGQKVNVMVGEKMTGDYTASYLSLLGLGEILGDDVVSITGTPPNYVDAGGGRDQPADDVAEPAPAVPAGQDDAGLRKRAVLDERGRHGHELPRHPTPGRRRRHRADAGRVLPDDPEHRHGRPVLLPGEPSMKNLALCIVGTVALAVALPNVARAGRGGSPQAIQQAIAANSVDAIQAELERAEHLVCAACVDLVMPLVDHPDYRVRKVAAWWLARRGVSPQVQVAMLNRLSQSDSTAARNAADVLGEMHNPASVPALGAALSNPIFSAEARGGDGPGAGHDRPAGLHVVPDVGAGRRAAAGARGLAGRASEHPRLPRRQRGGDAGGDADPTVRAEAAVTIATFRYAGGADALVGALNDPSPNVRKKAAWALGEIHAPSSVAGGALSNAASNDASAAVRSLAHAALTKLSAD